MDASRSVGGGQQGAVAFAVPEVGSSPSEFPGLVRGSLIRALVDTYESDHGDRALGRLLADLSAESRTICLQGILESGWYPQQTFVELAWATHRRLGPDGCIDLAFRSQRRHLLRLRRLVNRAEGPKALIPCVTKAWRRYHDTGRARVEQLEDNRATLAVEGNAAILEPGYTEAVLGALLALVKIGGAARVRGTIDRSPPDRALLEIVWS